jgi:F0F1-type ATP synthase membrane subunit c/vacuolar-type H+-ATPase subunit K
MLGYAIVLLVAINLIAQLRFLILCVVMGLKRAREIVTVAETVESPKVAIQIATYREALILPRLLKSIMELDWPGDRMTVQILDDSVGADAAATKKTVEEFASNGVHFEYINRQSRAGFKAGALNHGLETAQDIDLIAYFDADCRPRPDFLKRIVPQFQDVNVAGVQARWEYPNGAVSPLTMAQQAAFEYLFRYEYGVRHLLGSPVFYLGSSAVWRRQAMEQLGGWRISRFTAEDVDLGCRAGNAGWKVLYEPTVLADDDALEEILAFRAQQRRWACAVSQAGLDAAHGLLNAPRSFLGRLVDVTGLLPHATIPLTMITAVLIAIDTLLGSPEGPLVHYSKWVFALFVVMPPSIVAMFLANRYFHPRHWTSHMRLLALAGPVAAATMTSFIFGFADLLRKRAEFIATPKAGQVPVAKESRWRWLSMHYTPLIFDGVIMVVLLLAAGLAVRRGLLGSAISTGVLGAAYLGSLVQSIAAIRRHRTNLATRGQTSK